MGKTQQFVVFLLLVLYFSARVEAIPFMKWQVHIVNGLSNGETLSVHCKSRDDDLGQQFLPVGAEFNWHFRVNFWDTTLFYCYLRYPKGQVSFEAFWVEKKSLWLTDKCTERNCFWVAEDHGIYLKDNPSGTEQLIHVWKSI